MEENNLKTARRSQDLIVFASPIHSPSYSYGSNFLAKLVGLVELAPLFIRNHAFDLIELLLVTFGLVIHQQFICSRLARCEYETCLSHTM
jgi:hypothetical protein